MRKHWFPILLLTEEKNNEGRRGETGGVFIRGGKMENVLCIGGRQNGKVMERMDAL